VDATGAAIWIRLKGIEPMNATSNWLAPVLRNRMVMFILAIAVLVPLAFTPVSAKNPALGAALLEGCAIVLLSMLLARADWRGGLGKKVVDFSKSAANLPVLLFLAVAGASILIAPDKQLGIQEFLRLGSGAILYFAIAHHVRRSDQLSCLADVVLFLCCAISITGFVQFDAQSGTFATGLFGDHQLYGSVLMALLPVAAAIAVSEKSAARQLFARCATVLVAAGLLISHSRSGWIGAGAAITFLVVVSLVQMVRKHRSQAHLKKHEIVPTVVLLVAAVGVFMFLWPHSSTVLGRANTLTAVSTDGTWHSRQLAWAGAEKMIAQSPLTGKGLGGSQILMNPYAGVGLPLATLPGMRPSLSEQTHNLYLQTAAEVGIPGLLLFLSIPVTLLIVGIRRAMHMDDGIKRTLLLGAMASTVGILVDAIASPSWQMGTVSLFMWLLLGIVASCMQPNARRERSAIAETVAQPKARPVFAYAALGLAALLPTAAMAAAPGYVHIARIRLVPSAATITGGQSQTFQVLGTFADANGGLSTTEDDLTNNPGTTFSFSTTSGSLGFLKGTNGSTYQSDSDGNYTAFITATFNDGQGGSASASATVTVLKGPGHGDNIGSTLTYAGAGAAIVLWALAHHASSDRIDFDAGDDRREDARLNSGLESYGQALPSDSPFFFGQPTGETDSKGDGK
jgi:putative inorganic carbon (HCO3(-)) transporter